MINQKFFASTTIPKIKKFPCGAIYEKCILLGFIMHCSIYLKKDVFSVIEFGEGNEKISGGENKKNWDYIQPCAKVYLLNKLIFWVGSIQKLTNFDGKFFIFFPEHQKFFVTPEVNSRQNYV